MWLYSCQSTCNVCSLLLPYTKWFQQPEEEQIWAAEKAPTWVFMPFLHQYCISESREMHLRGWLEKGEDNFPASCGNKVNGATKINHAQTTLDSEKSCPDLLLCILKSS